MRDIFFFSAGHFLRQVFNLQDIFLHRNQSARYFFSEITHTPLKSQMVGESVSTIFVSYFRSLSGDYFASGNIIKLADLKPYWHFIRLNTACLTLLFPL